MSYTIQQGKKLNSLLGFKGLTSNHTLYKAAANTYTRKGDSAWTLTHGINVNDEITRIEINTTYFRATPEVIALHKHIDSLNTKKEYTFGISMNAAIEFLEGLKK